MPTLPWTAPKTPPTRAEAIVFASRFETRTLWGALRFLLRTPKVWRQVSRAAGGYGATLKAAPLKRTFWTLSAWESAEALKAFAASAPHGPVAAGLRTHMRSFVHRTWRTTTDELPVDWEDAMRRFA